MGRSWNEKHAKSCDYPAKRVVLLTDLEAKGSQAIAPRLARATGTGRVTENVTGNAVGIGMENATVTGNVVREIENAIETGTGTGIVIVVMTRIVIASRARSEIDQVKPWRRQSPPPHQSPVVFPLVRTPLDTDPLLRSGMMVLAKDAVLLMMMSVTLFG